MLRIVLPAAVALGAFLLLRKPQGQEGAPPVAGDTAPEVSPLTRILDGATKALDVGGSVAVGWFGGTLTGAAAGAPIGGTIGGAVGSLGGPVGTLAAGGTGALLTAGWGATIGAVVGGAREGINALRR